MLSKRQHTSRCQFDMSQEQPSAVSSTPTAVAARKPPADITPLHVLSDSMRISPLRRRDDASPTTRDLLTPSPLRSTFVENRDQLFMRMGMKTDQLREKFDSNIRPLHVIAYPSWGSATAVPLPIQLNVPSHLADTVRCTLPFIDNAVVQAHITLFYKLLTKSSRYVDMICDLFWFFFLEYFSVAETQCRFDKYRLELLEKIKAEEPVIKRKRHHIPVPPTGHHGGGVAEGAQHAVVPAATAATGASASPRQRQGQGPPLPPIGGGGSANVQHPLWQQHFDHTRRPSTKRDSFHTTSHPSHPVVSPRPPHPSGGTNHSFTPGRKRRYGPPKPIDELLVDEDDWNVDDANEGISIRPPPPTIHVSSTTASHATGPSASSTMPNPRLAAQEMKERQKREFIQKLKRRQLVALPSHVLSGQQAFNFKYVSSSSAVKSSGSASTPRQRLTEEALAQQLPSQAIKAHHGGGLNTAEMDDDDDGQWSASYVSVVSSFNSATTGTPSDVDSVNGSDLEQETESHKPRSGRFSAQPSLARQLADAAKIPTKYLVRGEKNFGQALAILLDAEELEATEGELLALHQEVTSYSPEGAQKGMAVIRLACEMVRREQRRMFGRMAHQYVHIVKDMSEMVRKIVTPTLPDILARVVVQLLWSSLPYARDVLTRRVRKQIKKKITYWMGGVESGNIEEWTRAPVCAPLTTSVTNAAGNSEFREAQLKRLDDMTKSRTQHSTAANDGGKGFGALGSATHHRRSAGHGDVILSGRAPDASSLTHNSTQSQVSGSGAGQTADTPSPVLQYSTGLVAFHKAMDEILDDFDRMRLGGSVPVAAPRNRSHHSGGGTSRSSRGKRRGQSDDPQKPLETHRHAPSHRRSELWHEQGRNSTAAVKAESKSRQGYFDMGNQSPFMKRYLKDAGIEGTLVHQRVVTRLIRWTSS